MPKIKPEKLLTEFELELMVILWRLGKASIREVLEHLDRELAYTSVATIIRILEQKKFLKSEKDGKTLIYRPVVSKSSYEAFSLDRMVNRLFDDRPLALVARLIDHRKLSPEEVAMIRSLLDEQEDP